MNLLEETTQVITSCKLTPEDIEFINIPDTDMWSDVRDRRCVVWDEFKIYAEECFKNYDNGYGGAEVPTIEIVFNNGSWLERGGYDGSEYWEYREAPVRNTVDAI